MGDLAPNRVPATKPGTILETLVTLGLSFILHGVCLRHPRLTVTSMKTKAIHYSSRHLS